MTTQDQDDEKIAQDHWPEDSYDELAPQIAFLEGAAYGRKAEREKILSILRGDECAGNGRLTWGPHIADWLEKKFSKLGGNVGEE